LGYGKLVEYFEVYLERGVRIKAESGLDSDGLDTEGRHHLGIVQASTETLVGGQCS